MSARARWRRFASVAGSAILMVLAACGGSASGNEVGSGGDDETSATADEDAGALEFAECVRDNGVDMPDPASGQQGLIDAYQVVADDYDQATLQQALTACQDLMPQYPAEQQAHPTDDDWILDLAECLRDQGLDVSDDPFSEAHRGDIDMNEFSAAMEVCRDQLGGGQ